MAASSDFGRVYEEHVWSVYGFIGYRVNSREEAEDLTQVTFERALKAWGRYDAARASEQTWLLTIARNVSVDAVRREKPTAQLDEIGELPRRPAYAELEHLTGDLPPAERAAVVLRYAYDMPYAAIGAALGSSEDAARQAASAGVRRLRKEHV